MTSQLIQALVSVAVGLTIANYAYQVINRQRDWQVALERSAFQVAALGIFLIAWVLR